MDVKITRNLTKFVKITNEFRNMMNMQDRFGARLGKTCSILVAIWIHLIKLLNRSEIKKATKVKTSWKDLTSLL